jgi:hypothetical protein
MGPLAALGFVGGAIALAHAREKHFRTATDLMTAVSGAEAELANAKVNQNCRKFFVALSNLERLVGELDSHITSIETKSERRTLKSQAQGRILAAEKRRLNVLLGKSARNAVSGRRWLMRHCKLDFSPPRPPRKRLRSRPKRSRPFDPFDPDSPPPERTSGVPTRRQPFPLVVVRENVEVTVDPVTGEPLEPGTPILTEQEARDAAKERRSAREARRRARESGRRNRGFFRDDEDE